MHAALVPVSMPWACQHLLNQAYPLIGFCDAVNLIKDLQTTPEFVTDTAFQEVEELRVTAHKGTIPDSWKRKAVAKLFLKIICTVLVGHFGWNSADKLYALESKCPRLPDKGEMEALLRPPGHYASVRLGVRRKKSFPYERRFLQIYLHRMVTWLAHGEQPVVEGGKPVLALHSCANKECLNPEHLRWGVHSNNADDAYLHEHNVRMAPKAAGRKRAAKRKRCCFPLRLCMSH